MVLDSAWWPLVPPGLDFVPLLLLPGSDFVTGESVAFAWHFSFSLGLASSDMVVSFGLFNASSEKVFFHLKGLSGP